MDRTRRLLEVGARCLPSSRLLSRGWAPTLDSKHPQGGRRERPIHANGLDSGERLAPQLRENRRAPLRRRRPPPIRSQHEPARNYPTLAPLARTSACMGSSPLKSSRAFGASSSDFGGPSSRGRGAGRDTLCIRRPSATIVALAHGPRSNARPNIDELRGWGRGGMLPDCRGSEAFASAMAARSAWLMLACLPHRRGRYKAERREIEAPKGQRDRAERFNATNGQAAQRLRPWVEASRRRKAKGVA